MKCCAFTGHRPDKLGGYNESTDLNIWVKRSLMQTIIKCYHAFEITKWISGGALGVDQWAAEIILYLKINQGYPFNLTIMKPFDSFYSIWPEHSQERFLNICKEADEVITCQPEPMATWKFEYRNKQMIKNSNLLIAVWNGSESGTGNCLRYANLKKLPIILINPSTRLISFDKKNQNGK